jgi:replicative DNA helicase
MIMERNMYNIEVERTILGALLLDPDTLIASESITVSDFVDKNHQNIYKAIKEAQKVGPVDLMTVDDHLRTAGTLDSIGGGKYLVELTNSVYGTSNFVQWVEILQDYSKKRGLHEKLKDGMSRIVGGMESLGEITVDMMDYLRQLAPTQKSYVTLREVIEKTVKMIQDRAEGKCKPIKTGFGKIDKVFYGFNKGELTIIGARPSVRKSAFGMHIACEAAKQGKKVGFISLEMVDIQYGMRTLSSYSSVEMSKLQEGALSEEEFDKYVKCIAPVSTLSIYYDQSVQTIEKLVSTAYQMVTKDKMEMIIIDYLQLLRSNKNFKDMYAIVGYVSMTLKRLALDLDIPIIALSQLSRAAKDRRDKRPTLTDLRESGQIEQDADNVILMHREEDMQAEWLSVEKRSMLKSFNDIGTQLIMLRVEKQRQGQTFSTHVAFHPEIMQFRQIDWIKTKESTPWHSEKK